MINSTFQLISAKLRLDKTGKKCISFARCYAVCLALLTLGSLAQGGQSLQLTAGAVSSYTLPEVSPYTLSIQAAQSFKFQFRVHNWAPVDGSYSEHTLFTTHGDAFWCGIDSSSNLNCVDWWDSLDDSNASVNVAGRSDFVVTVERDLAVKTFYAQVCNVDGTNCVNSATRNILGAANGSSADGRISSITFGATFTSAQLAYFRWRTGTGPVSPPRDTDPVADLLDFEFEGTLQASGTTAPAAAASVSAAPVFAATPVYAPGCQAGVQQTFRAGYAAVLDGKASLALNGVATLTYKWKELSGPTQVTVKNVATATPTINGMVFGSYVFSLTVTDSNGRSSSCSVKHGAVATDANGVITYPTAYLTQIFGPSIRWGANPWPWFDERHKALAKYFGALQTQSGPAGYKDFWNTANAGTITVQSGSNTVTGTNTNFLSAFCAGGNTVSPASDVIIIWYPLPDGSTGRRAYPVRSCESDTSLTIGLAFAQTSGTGVSYTISDDTGQGSQPLGVWYNGSTNANYYDNVMAFYAMYYRSGIDDYLSYARTLADRWWTMPYIDQGRTCSDDGGYWCLAPRVRAVTGLVLRALDGRPDMFPGLRLWWDYDGNAMINGTQNPIYDIREEGGYLNELSLGGLYDPDATRRTKYQDLVSTVIKSKWAVQQQPNGNWVSPLYGNASWNGMPGTVTVTTGSNLVVGNGTSWDCSRTDEWGNGLRLWTTDAPNDFVHGDPIDYAVTCLSPTTLSITPAYQGATKSGRGWHSGPISGQGTQPFILGFLANAMVNAAEAVKTSHADASALAKKFVVDAVNWIRNPAYGGYRTDWQGLWYGRVFIGCEPNPAATSTCMGSEPEDNTPSSVRYLAAETMHAFASAYLYSQDPGILAAGDALYGAMYGRQGGPVVPNDGIDLCDFLCDGSWDVSHNKAKTFGFAFGWGNGASWPAARLGGAQRTTTRRLAVPFSLSSASTATHVRLRVTEPTGASTEYVCTTSPCNATVESDGAENLVSVEYLNEAAKPAAPALTTIAQ